MQKCYNCGLEVDDNVLICPECGALVKRYGRPEPQEQTQEEAYTFSDAPQPQGAVWRLPNGRLKFRGYVTFWLVVSAIFTGYTLFGFACMLFIVRFQDFYFEALRELPELAQLETPLRAIIESLAQYPAYYIAMSALVAVQFACTIWLLAAKKKLAFYIMAAAGALLTIAQLIFGGGLSALLYVFGPLVTWILLRRSWNLLR